MSTLPVSTIKAWLRSKRVGVWPTVTKDLTDELELEEAAFWLQGQLEDLLRFAAETTPPPPWPAPASNWNQELAS